MTRTPSGPFFIVSKFNKRVLDVEGASIKNNAKICAWSRKDDSDNENQLWEFRDGYFVNVKSGKVLDVKGKAKSDVHLIQAEKAFGHDAKPEEIEKQRWNVDHEGYIHNAANHGLVIDIRGAEDADGAEIILYEKRSGTVSSNQQWDFVPHC